MESTYKNRPKIIAPMMLGAVLLISLGINGWLYSKLTTLNQGITGIQTELVGIQKEYDALSLKIEDGKGNLLELQKENSQAEQRIANQQTKQVLSDTTEQKQQLNPQPQPKPQPEPEKPTDNNGAGKYPITEQDQNGNGIRDDFEDCIIDEDDEVTTHPDPDFNMH